MMPRISVVVPTYKRPHLLDRCLVALFAQDFDPRAYEIVIADDAAHEPTRQVVARWMAQQQDCVGPRLHYVPVTGNHGPAAARNCGWRAAMGEIIAFTDDDCVPARNWLNVAVVAFTGNIDAAWGKIVMPIPADPTDYERDAARLQSAEFATANCFCRREILAAHGGLDESFTVAWREDSDLFFSLLEQRAAIRYVPDAVVVHPVRPAPWGASLRQQRKILFDALLYKKHPRLYREKIRATPRWDYYGISGALLTTLFASASGNMALALGTGALWGLLTGRLSLYRLRDTSRHLTHVAEMVITSALIPPLAVFWRIYGALKFRVIFL